jgi:alkaline phosphatase D
VWDDHGVSNDWAGDSPEWSKPDPYFMTRRANAAKAFYEHMPLRRASLPNGPNIRIHRRFDYGEMARFHMLDTRQFRSRQACGGGRKNCAEVTEPSRTMLGAAQEQWLEEGLESSRARWNIIGNQILMTKVDLEPGPDNAFAMDDWGGYEAARRRLTDFLGARRPSGPVVITGNNHYHFVGDLKSDYRNEHAPTVATEFLGTAISSTGDAIEDGPFVERWKAVLAENPQAKYFLRKPGYVVCALDRETCRADFRIVPVISTPGAPLETSARFVVENRKPGAERASSATRPTSL